MKTALRKAYEERFGEVSDDLSLFDSNGNLIYHEESGDNEGIWQRNEYDARGNKTYYEHCSGYWFKYMYDCNDNVLYYEESEGYWETREYNDKGDCIYRKNSNGEWERRGFALDKRPTSLTCDGKTVTIDGKEYTLNEVKK